MTREELKEHCKKQIEMCEFWAKAKGENPCGKVYEEHKMILELLEQEPCEDAVSRAELKKWLDINFSFGGALRKLELFDRLDRDLPSVTPQPKIGNWITHEEKFNALGMAVKGGVKCSECGYTTHNTLHMELGCPFKFCPNCGAKMIDLQESEDK